jgi:pimeloyl-ACP methyl ester carboxylesterase
MSPLRRRIARWSAATLACAVTPLLSALPTAAEPAPARCAPTSFAVPHGVMGATVCLPARRADTVVVLMPGSMLNQAYWDFPYQPQTYSMTRALNAAGYATLVVDRLGSGASSRPPAASVDSTVEADGLHDIVAALRRGLPRSGAFRRVVLGGVSLSSGIDVLEASTYHDVDGVLLTGYSHALNIPGTLGVLTTFHPADADPRFDARRAGPGYLTTVPGTTAGSFYGPGDVDPRVIAVAEATEDVFAISEYLDGLPSTLPGMSARITAPVLVVDGSRDVLCLPAACASSAALLAEETPYFAPAARLRAFVLPGSGHAVNLARNTGEYHAAVLRWLDSL